MQITIAWLFYFYKLYKRSVKGEFYVDVYGNICTAVYVLSSDYGVVIIMSLSDAPAEILKEIEL